MSNFQWTPADRRCFDALDRIIQGFGSVENWMRHQQLKKRRPIYTEKIAAEERRKSRAFAESLTDLKGKAAKP